MRHHNVPYMKDLPIKEKKPLTESSLCLTMATAVFIPLLFTTEQQ